MKAIDTTIEAFAHQQLPPPTHVEFTADGKRATFPVSEVAAVYSAPGDDGTLVFLKSSGPALPVKETHDEVLKLLGWNPARIQ